MKAIREVFEPKFLRQLTWMDLDKQMREWTPYGEGGSSPFIH
jgi:hypothetical protein